MVRCRAVAALIVASLGSGVSVDAAPATDADVRLVATARSSIRAGEFLTVRTTWTARRRVALVAGAE
jgi:hypothetical protein